MRIRHYRALACCNLRLSKKGEEARVHITSHPAALAYNMVTIHNQSYMSMRDSCLEWKRKTRYRSKASL